MPSPERTAPVEVVEDARYQDHRGPEGHPERPERLIAMDQALEPFRDRLQPLAAREEWSKGRRLVPAGRAWFLHRARSRAEPPAVLFQGQNCSRKETTDTT